MYANAIYIVLLLLRKYDEKSWFLFSTGAVFFKCFWSVMGEIRRCGTVEVEGMLYVFSAPVGARYCPG
jgi:hypothetical protein